MTETSHIFDNALYTDDNLDILGDNISSQVEDVILGATITPSDGVCGKLDVPLATGITPCIGTDTGHTTGGSSTCGLLDAGFECPAVQSPPTACTGDLNACMFVSGTCNQYSLLTPTTSKFL